MRGYLIDRLGSLFTRRYAPRERVGASELHALGEHWRAFMCTAHAAYTARQTAATE